MQIKAFTGAAVLLALTPSVVGSGSATVVNNCGFPIYYASVAQNGGTNMQQLQGSFSEGYGQEGVGVSIKLAMSADASGPVSQFEFTMANGKISYDLSNINGYPFSNGGMEVVPSMQGDPNNPTCVPVNCPAGQSVCTAAYNAPEETRTMVCDQNSNLVLTMCPGGSGKAKRDQPLQVEAATTSAPRDEPVEVEAVQEQPATRDAPQWNGDVRYRLHPRHLPTRI